LLVSRANEDIVVSEPQNPTATSIEYFVSRFQKTEIIENTPKMKLPITLTIRTLTGRTPNMIGEETILYLRNAPAAAPMTRRMNSILSFFSYSPPCYIFY